MVRLFIGIDLPRLTKDKLFSLGSKIPLPSNSKLKWVEAENMHITLKFLGEIEDSKIKSIIDSLSKISFKSFDCRISKFSPFPSLKLIKIISGIITKGDVELKELANLVDESLSKIVPRESRGFTTHLTLARVKTPGNKEEFGEAVKKPSFDIDFKVNEFKLIKSVLTETGPKYTTLYVFPLSK